MRVNYGVVKPGSTIYIPFDTFDKDDSSSITMTGLAVTDIEVYKDGGTTQRASDSGYTLLDTDGIDFDGITGIHGFSISLADNTTAGFWAAGSRYFVVVSTITVDAVTVSFIAAEFSIGYPAAVLDTTIATLSSQTSFTLTVGPAEDDALNGMWVLIHDVASAVQCSWVQILDYTGATKTVTLVAGPTFTAAATDNISIMGPTPLQPTVIGRTVDVSTGGEVGLDWANIGSPTTAQNLSATNIDVDQVVASVSGAVGSVTGAVGSVTGAVGSVTGAVGSVGAGGIATTSFAAGAINAAAIATDAIGAAELADGAITAATFAAGAIDAASIAADAITAAKIADGAIDAATFAAGAINAAAIASDAITDAKVASDVTIASVTGAVGSVTGAVGSVASGGIAAASFAAGAIDAAAIAANAIGASELAADAVTEIQSGLSTLTAAGIRTAVGLGSANLDTQLDAVPTYMELLGFFQVMLRNDAAVQNDLSIVYDAINADTGTGIGNWNGNDTLQGLDDDTQTILGRIPGALVGGRMDSSVGAMAAAVITAAAIAANAINDSKVDPDVTIASVTGAVGSVTGHTPQTGDNFARLGAPAGASVSADIAAIEAQTDDIGANGAGLSAIPWNSNWDAEVQSEATDALNAYDPPTRTEATSDKDEILTQLPAAPVKNAAFTYVIKMVDSTDHATPETGLTVTMTRSIDGAAFGAATGVVTEISTGHYKVVASAADMNGDVVTHRFTSTGADDLTIEFKTVS